MRKRIFLLLVFMLATSACTDKTYSFHSTANPSGVNIGVGLVANHPFLAEYKRYIIIDGKKVYFGEDTGGYAYINVFDTNDKLILQTFWENILIIDKDTKQYTIAERGLEESEQKSFIGKFCFTKPGKYEFIPKEIDPEFSGRVVKGG